MPPQSRAAHVFAGVAVEIDLILKGIKTLLVAVLLLRRAQLSGNRPDSQRD